MFSLKLQNLTNDLKDFLGTTCLYILEPCRYRKGRVKIKQYVCKKGYKSRDRIRIKVWKPEELQFILPPIVTNNHKKFGTVKKER